jgi:ketosteroid isomerase-like protein
MPVIVALARPNAPIWLFRGHRVTPTLRPRTCTTSGADKRAEVRRIADSKPLAPNCCMALKTDTVTVETLAAFADAWNRHDLDALMSFMSEDCEFHAVAGPDVFGRSFVGRAAVREGFPLVWQTFPDAAWTEPSFFVCGDRGVAESTFRGTRAADGLRIEARMVDVFTFRGNKIVVKNAYRKDRPAFKPA